MQQLLVWQRVQKHAHGNAATASSASKCTGNSATATKLATKRNIKLQGAVNGNADFDGSANLVINTAQGNIVTLTGSVKTPEANSGTLTGITKLNYPSGYNRTNCVVLSIMGGKIGDTSTLTTPMEVSSTGRLLGAGGLAVSLQADHIAVRREKTDDIEPSTNTNFKLILIKI